MRVKDIAGKRFGLLTALYYLGNGWWRARCDCGLSAPVRGEHLRSGHTRSCGGHKSALIRLTKGDKWTMQQTPLGNSWLAMVQRCENPKNPNYKSYGARGIRICESLRVGPIRLENLIGGRQRGMTLERKDNDGNYSCGECDECISKGWPLNVCWKSRQEQLRNTSRNWRVELAGRIICAKDAAQILGIHPNTFAYRYLRDAKKGEVVKLKIELA